MKSQPSEQWRGELVIGAGWARFVGSVGAAVSEPCVSARIAMAMCAWISVPGETGTRHVIGTIARPGTALVIDTVRPYAQVMFLDARLSAVRRHDPTASSGTTVGRDRGAHWRRAIYSLEPDFNIDQVLYALLPARRTTSPRESADDDPAISDARILKEWDHAQDIADACRQPGRLPTTTVAHRDGGRTLHRYHDCFRHLFGLPPGMLLRGLAPVSEQGS